MAARLRDDVMVSGRLLAGTDRWVAIDLIAGIAGYVVWVSGSAALGLQVASLADYAVAPGGTPTVPVLGALALLWLIVPAALGVARVRSRLLNLRNNIDQDYRLDRPAALLVPPALLVIVLLAAMVATGTVEPLLFGVLAPATLYLLVRTVTYSYRVYAFSHPTIPYASLFVTLITQAAVLVLYLGVTTENAGLVRGTIDRLGLPVDPLGTTEVAGLTFPIGPAVAVALPIVLVAAYLLVQTIAALVVRVRDPTVRPRDTRTGQRYPPWLEVASNGGQSSPTQPARTATSPGSSSASGSQSSTGGSSGGASGGSPSGTAGGSSTGRSAVEGTSASGDSTTTSSTGSGGATATGDSETDAADEDAESVSHTRVFTPPDGSEADPLAPTEDGEACPACDATVPADTEQCPACGAEVA